MNYRFLICHQIKSDYDQPSTASPYPPSSRRNKRRQRKEWSKTCKEKEHWSGITIFSLAELLLLSMPFLLSLTKTSLSLSLRSLRLHLWFRLSAHCAPPTNSTIDPCRLESWKKNFLHSPTRSSSSSANAKKKLFIFFSSSPRLYSYSFTIYIFARYLLARASQSRDALF